MNALNYRQFILPTAVVKCATIMRKKQTKSIHLRPMSHQLGMNYYVNFLGGLGSNEFHIKQIFGPHGS